MTESEKLSMVSRMIAPDVADNDTLLLYLNLAKDVILNRLYPFESNKTMPSMYGMIQCQIAVELFNKRGAEGQTTHDENGVKRVWASSLVSPHLLKLIHPFVGGVVNASSSEE